MTLPPMEKEGHLDKEEKKQEENIAHAEEEIEKEEKIEYESDPVDSCLCIQLFCIEEKYEMRYVAVSI